MFALKTRGTFILVSQTLTTAFEERIAALEGGVGALTTASGMAAEPTLFWRLLTQVTMWWLRQPITVGPSPLENPSSLWDSTAFVDVDNLEEVEAAIYNHQTCD